MLGAPARTALPLARHFVVFSALVEASERPSNRTGADSGGARQSRCCLSRLAEPTAAPHEAGAVLDEYIAEDFSARNPPLPGVSLDRDGMKQAAEIFRVATPGCHDILIQVAEGDLVVSHIVGRGVHEGELLGIPATNREVETNGIAIHRVRDGKIVEYWSVVDVARVLQQVGALPGPPG